MLPNLVATLLVPATPPLQPLAPHLAAAIMRRVEESTNNDGMIDAFLPDHGNVQLVVNAIAPNQQSSGAVCVACHLLWYTLLECNRFVDYLVAKTLAQCHPALRAQIANSPSFFCTRLTAVNNARARMPPSTLSRTVRSFQIAPVAPDSALAPDASALPIYDELSNQGFHQHSLHIDGAHPDDDFEASFHPLSSHFVYILGADGDSPMLVEAASLPPPPADDTFSVCGLAASYDNDTASVCAHADNDPWHAL
ncbi:hypothetical protein MHU86_24994 [Fragilaria crotonensis]|nr:hypothetical protein MHU86_24994 [Fragilaria crotonensis]